MAVHAEGPLATSGQLDFFFLQQRKTTQVNLQKDVISIKKQLSCKKSVQPYAKLLVWKKLSNTGGGQEMAVMVGQWQKF